ncbi:Phage minor tail protein [Azospirillum argentinense]|uniref:phage minor tail protein L n=1 Tax=Azospirillum argentinense TaxID=2970906 RepID=UPI0032DF1589
MTTDNAKLASEIQKPQPSAYVTLFQLDLTALGGIVYAFTQSQHETAALRYGGVEYTPIDIEAEGFEWNGTGSLPTPKIRVANVNRAFSALVGAYGDLLGAQVTRIRTFRRFLDGEPEADAAAHLPLDVYRIERKATHNKVFIEWELAAVLDQEGRLLPGRQILRDACMHRYRRWTGAGFDYTRASCPYAGGAMFKATGEPTGAGHEDVCGKRLSDCKLRFGANAVLPTRAFPGVARLRV